MKVTTEIKKIDLILFNLVIFPQLKSTYKGMLILAGIIFTLIFVIKGFPQSQKAWFTILVASGLGGFSGIVVGFLFSLIYILFTSSEKNGTLGFHEYEVTNEGLYEQTPVNEGLNKWEGITEIRTTNSYLLFQITGYLFHIIPKRSFESQDSYEKFKNFSIQQWELVHNQ